MRLLLDTHILIWLVNRPADLNDRERAAIAAFLPADIGISVISLWELRIKWEALDRFGRRKGALDPMLAAAYADRSRFTIAPLERDAAVAALATPARLTDPFDRALLIHAQALSARLLTRDRQLAGHPLVYPS